jgi:hydroxyacylglutathione hydrolase
MKKIVLSMMVIAACLSVNAQDTAPTKPFEDGLKESVVLRADDVVFRQIDKHTWYGTGHLMANESIYLLEGSKSAMLIDCGTVMRNLDKLVAKLTKKPVTLYLTHVHPDHAGAVDYFKEVYINPADTVGIPEFMPQYKGRVCFLKDRQIIDLGGRKILVVFTPAHTPGSTTFIDIKNHVGFSGDSFGNGNLLLTGTFPTLNHSSKVMSKVMSDYQITQLWNGHFFGMNAETPKRVADLSTISEDVLSGRLNWKPNNSALELGLYDWIDTLGVNIRFSDGALLSESDRANNIEQVYAVLKNCRDIYIAAEDGDQPVIFQNNAFNAYETDLYLAVPAKSEMTKLLAKNNHVSISAKTPQGTLAIKARLAVDIRVTSKEALLQARPDLQGLITADANTVIYKLKNAYTTIGRGNIIRF